MYFYVSVKSEQAGFLGAVVLDAANDVGACRKVVRIVKASGHTCDFEMLAIEIPPRSHSALPPTYRLLSYEELEAWFADHGGLREVKT